MDSASHDGFTVSSTHDSAEQIALALQTPAPAASAEAQTPPAELPADATPEPAPAATGPERNPDGTFKAASPKGKPGSAPEKKPYQSAAEARIGKAVAAQKDAERRAAQLEQELTRYRTPPAPAAPPQAPAKPTEDSEPDPNRYEGLQYDPRYIRDLTAHHARLAWQAIAQQQQQKADQARDQQLEQERMRGHQERLTAARTKYPDFDQRLNLDTWISTPMAHAITESPVGPELLLYLSDHPQDAQRIATLHPIQAMREMGKLEARYDAATPGTGSAPAPAMSQAKPVIKPVTGGPATSERDEYRDDEPFEAHVRRENARDRTAAQAGGRNRWRIP